MTGFTVGATLSKINSDEVAGVFVLYFGATVGLPRLIVIHDSSGFSRVAVAHTHHIQELLG